jgi:acyl-CoA thioester hydrolase
MAEASAPLALHDDHVRPEWVDYNGHLSEAYYILVFGYASDALLDLVGMDAAYRERTATSLYTVEAHVCYLAEVGEGAPLHVTTRIVDVDRKRVHVFHELFRGRGGERLATSELVMLHVDTEEGRAAPMTDELVSSFTALRDAHRALPPDERLGRAISLRRR